jgi:hypothetical protein
MTVQKGQTILIGARRYKAGSEVPDKIAKASGLDVSATKTSSKTTGSTTTEKST